MRTPDRINLLSVIIPLYDEEDTVPFLLRRLNAVRANLTVGSEVILVNDGSRDLTRELLNQAAAQDPTLKIIHFTRNFGAQTAVNAGMRVARGEAVVIMDGDLQDPPEVIPALIEKFMEGHDVVFGQRLSREGETLAKKLTSALFCHLFKLSSTVPLPQDTEDFCLISRRVMRNLLRERNSQALLRATVNALGYPTAHVPFSRPARVAGRTKYSFVRMSQLALDSIFAFSPRLLRLTLAGGVLLSGGGLICSAYFGFAGLKEPELSMDWKMFWGLQIFIAGVTLMAVGLIGEYVRRNFEMLKQRPTFVVHSSRNLTTEDCSDTALDSPLWV